MPWKIKRMRKIGPFRVASRKPVTGVAPHRRQAVGHHGNGPLFGANRTGSQPTANSGAGTGASKDVPWELNNSRSWPM